MLNDSRSMLTGMGRWIGVIEDVKDEEEAINGSGKTSKSDRKALKDDENVVKSDEDA